MTNEKVYRVSESYHSDSESGTYEYGFYTGENAKERAMKRAKEVCNEKHPNVEFEKREYGYRHDSWSGYSTVVEVKEYPVNEPLNGNTVAHT